MNAAVNGNMPSMQITGLQSITSLTNLMPILPLPKPVNQHGTGSSLLQPAQRDLARRILETGNPELVATVGQALLCQPAELVAPENNTTKPTDLPFALAIQEQYPEAFVKRQGK